jgi:hypothetical protein
LNLKCDFRVSKFDFERVHLYRYDEVCVAWGRCPWPDEFSAGSTNIDLALVGAGMEAPMALAPSRWGTTS